MSNQTVKLSFEKEASSLKHRQQIWLEEKDTSQKFGFKMFIAEIETKRDIVFQS